MTGCEICGHVYAQMHRIKPGAWGGTYEGINVAYLCPNHHAAIHLLMKWYHAGGKLGTEDEGERLEAYLDDAALHDFWLETVKPIIRQRMVEEGRWYPYIRTLPPEQDLEGKQEAS